MDDYVNVWHHTLYCVCDDDLQTYIHVPLWHIVSERSIKRFPELLWVELRHVGVYNQDDETSIEELSYEGSFDDGTLLLRHGIFTNPGDEQYDDLFQDDVNTNDNSCNGKS